MVEAGAAWLDANHPGWRTRVDVDTLDFGDAAHTLLTQVVPVPPQRGPKPARFGYDVVFKQQKADGDPWEWLRAHGFLGEPEPLREMWVELIRAFDGRHTSGG